MYCIQRDEKGLRIYQNAHLYCAMDGVSAHMDEVERETLEKIRATEQEYLHRGFYWEKVEQIDGCHEWALTCSLQDKAREAREILFYEEQAHGSQ